MSAFESLSLGDSDAERGLSALLFIQASTNALDVYSALNSSPWTAQSFGADPEKRAACMEYVHHSIGVTAFYAIAAAAIAKNPWPIIGMVIADGYMYWLYKRALDRAQESGSKSWDDAGSSQGGSGGDAGYSSQSR
ncbi:MAG TPA: hypothetical protein VHU24_03150 [Solirubrobacterales bacterium]|jgi:hypothetical protein|nr:hypothetical protein [Solirubrobacterales bacterium]